MFVNKNTFFATIKEKEGKVDGNGIMSYSTYAVTMLNSQDIRIVEESSKRQFGNSKVEELIAEPILVFKSFQPHRVYICSWHYSELIDEVNKVVSGEHADSPIGAILEDLALNFDGKIDAKNTKFLDTFAMYLKNEMLSEINDADRRI
jgi:hypothetical protein